MTLIALIFLVVIAMGIGAASLWMRRQTTADTANYIRQRVSAYAQSVRRTGAPADLNAMSDMELDDVLMASARRLHIQTQRKHTVLMVGAAVAIIVSVRLANGQGLSTFAVGLAISGIALYGLERAMDRKIRQPLHEQGIDPNRLRIG